MFRPVLLALVLVVAPVAFAQARVVGADDPEKLFTSHNRKLNANKQVVLHIVRDLLEAGHWKDAPMYLSERYIQHNPMVASGLAPVMKFFGGMPERPIPKPSEWRTKVVSVVAEDDLVVVATVRTLRLPDGEGTYTTTWFDMWRIQDGKADEHWDGAELPRPQK
jgi:predicted SnoaL-like aldol condensation-catalyzing enzyme